MDPRSKKVALVAHCILNQNSIVYGLGRRPAMFKEVIDLLNSLDVGIIQLPCPETLYAGLRRFWQVKEQYDNPGFRSFCRKLAKEIVDMIVEYRRNGYELKALIGIAGSPSCGIWETNTSESWLGNPNIAGESKRTKGRGVFMEELIKALRDNGIESKFIDFDYSNPEESIAKIRDALKDK